MIDMIAKITPESDTGNSYPEPIDFEIGLDRSNVSLILSDRTITFKAKDIKQLASVLLEIN